MWDFVSLEAAAKIVQEATNAEDAANNLVKAAYFAHTSDNVSALVVDFKDVCNSNPVFTPSSALEELDAQGEVLLMENLNFAKNKVTSRALDLPDYKDEPILKLPALKFKKKR